EGLAHALRRVMEGRFDGELLVVEELRVDPDLGVGRTAAEELDDAPLAHGAHRGLRGPGQADGLDHDVHPAPVGAALAQQLREVHAFARRHHALRPHLERLVQPGAAAAGRGHVGPAHAREGDEHEADGPRADDGHGLAAPDPALLDAPDHAGQGLHHRRFAELEPFVEGEQVLLDHPRGDARELGVGAVPEEEVVAQARHLVAAVVAIAAGRGVGGHDGHARLEGFDSGRDLFHDARHLVPEHGRRHDHLRVVAAPEDLGVRAAGEGHPRPEQDVARLQRRHLHLLDAHVLTPVEHGRLHLRSHEYSPRCHTGAVRCSITFSTPGAGWAAISTARGASSREKRCVTSSRTRISRANTSWAARSWTSTDALYDVRISFSAALNAPKSIWTVSPGDVAANTMIRPPGLVASTACANGAWPNAARTARSAPRPPVRARTSRGTSTDVASRATEAPRRRAISRRSGNMSLTRTSAPAQRQSCISRSPIGPWPTTSTVCPWVTPAFRTAFRQVFTGSTKAASSGSTPSGTGIAPRSTIQSIAFTYSAKPPPAASNPAVVPLRL